MCKRDIYIVVGKVTLIILVYRLKFCKFLVPVFPWRVTFLEFQLVLTGVWVLAQGTIHSSNVGQIKFDVCDLRLFRFLLCSFGFRVLGHCATHSPNMGLG